MTLLRTDAYALKILKNLIAQHAAGSFITTFFSSEKCEFLVKTTCTFAFIIS